MVLTYTVVSDGISHSLLVTPAVSLLWENLGLRTNRKALHGKCLTLSVLEALLLPSDLGTHNSPFILSLFFSVL